MSQSKRINYGALTGEQPLIPVPPSNLATINIVSTGDTIDFKHVNFIPDSGPPNKKLDSTATAQTSLSDALVFDGPIVGIVPDITANTSGNCEIEITIAPRG